MHRLFQGDVQEPPQDSMQDVIIKYIPAHLLHPVYHNGPPAVCSLRQLVVFVHSQCMVCQHVCLPSTHVLAVY